MSTLMDEEIKRWTAKRKTALILEIIQVRPVCRKQAGPMTLPQEIGS